MRVIQLLPTFAYGDAVGNDTQAIREILLDMGYETAIYAEAIDSRLPKRIAEPVDKMPELKPEDVIIYHGSIGSELNYRLPQMKGRKMMVYHNITPPAFFRGYSREAENSTSFGLQGMKFLSDKIEYCIADSEYNKSDLRDMGFSCPIDVCPILIPFSDYEKTPNKKVLQKLLSDKCVNLLFVGRISPNKKQEDVIRTFYFYHKFFCEKSRLILAGGAMESYFNRLKNYVERLGIADCVIMPGHVKFDEILAYYHAADVFVCMSEHEGFCVPLVEAMFFDVPVVAYASTAIPGTLDGCGVLLEDKSPITAAKKIDELLSNETLRRTVVEAQKARLRDYAYETVSELLKNQLKGFIERERTDEKDRLCDSLV